MLDQESNINIRTSTITFPKTMSLMVIILQKKETSKTQEHPKTQSGWVKGWHRGAGGVEYYSTLKWINF